MEPCPASLDVLCRRSDGKGEMVPRGNSRSLVLRRALGGVALCLAAAAAVFGGSSAVASAHTGATVLAAGGSRDATTHARDSHPSTISPVDPTSTGRVTFGIAPSSSTGPDGRSWFNLGVTPGGVLRDHVALVNYSKTPLSLGLSATDAEETAGGSFGLLPPGAKSKSAGSWIALPAGSTAVVVPPKSTSGTPGTVVVPFSMDIPPTAAPGDYAGGLVASLRTVGTNSSGQRIVLYQRVGSRVYVQVAGQLTPILTVSDLHATYEQTLNPFGEGKAVVTYVLYNAGNVDLAVTQNVAVSEVIGSSRTAKVPAIALLLPGAAVTERVTVTGAWPQFRLSASVTARGHDPLGGGARAAATTASAGFWAIPWPLIVLILLVILAVALCRRYRRRAGAGGLDEASHGVADDGTGGSGAGAGADLEGGELRDGIAVGVAGAAPDATVTSAPRGKHVKAES